MNRRDLLAGASAIGAAVGGVAAVAAAAVAAPVSPDAALLSLIAEATAIDRESDRLWSLCPDEGGEEEWAAYDAHTDATVPRWRELARMIADTRAVTWPGMRAKAEFSLSSMPGDRRDDPDPWDRLAAAALVDAALLAGGAA